MKAQMSQVLKAASQGHYAVPAANFVDWHSAKSHVETSERLGLPLILAFAQVHDNWLSLEEAAAIGRYWQERAKTPVVLHLDHGQDIDFIGRAIDLGFNSVMIDASLKTFEENVSITRAVVELAHSRGVDVEAEIGFVGANANDSSAEVTSIYTGVDQAKAFVAATQVDSLAISIGTSHGLYKGTPKLNFERLQEIHQVLDTPLVLHGGSGSGDDNLKRCAQEGIAKINIFSDFMQAAQKALQNGRPTTSYPDALSNMRQAMGETLAHYYQVFETRPEKD